MLREVWLPLQLLLLLEKEGTVPGSLCWYLNPIYSSGNERGLAFVFSTQNGDACSWSEKEKDKRRERGRGRGNEKMEGKRMHGGRETEKLNCYRRKKTIAHSVDCHLPDFSLWMYNYKPSPFNAISFYPQAQHAFLRAAGAGPREGRRFR